MKVADIMRRDVVTVAPDAKVSDIARLMVEKNVSGLPVVTRGRVVGIVTETDLVVRNAHLHFPTFLQIMDARIYLENPRHFEEELRRMLGVTAAEVMTREVVTVTPETNITDVATIMFDKKVNPVPVVEKNRLVGIISRSDIIRLLIREEEI